MQLDKIFPTTCFWRAWCVDRWKNDFLGIRPICHFFENLAVERRKTWYRSVTVCVSWSYTLRFLASMFFLSIFLKFCGRGYLEKLYHRRASDTSWYAFCDSTQEDSCLIFRTKKFLEKLKNDQKSKIKSFVETLHLLACCESEKQPKPIPKILTELRLQIRSKFSLYSANNIPDNWKPAVKSVSKFWLSLRG